LKVLSTEGYDPVLKRQAQKRELKVVSDMGDLFGGFIPSPKEGIEREKKKES